MADAEKKSIEGLPEPPQEGEFFMAGIPASIILMGLVALCAAVIWPLTGMPVTLK